eukprot:gnl/MRDRNA2_/MRDRNA2_63470_c0_seq1.p1 gnl/MRDRNA2_/MRDRNA2_63470_c0~~gnl/MRDRNA2_/MRDRNA2_63470_c0_seq1.p1  ORF type:complete len:113 (+),score=17.44 gnl/MRDRNA2_/MRDRNA2_63470_c0_seq1:497-835(+)
MMERNTHGATAMMLVMHYAPERPRIAKLIDLMLVNGGVASLSFRLNNKTAADFAAANQRPVLAERLRKLETYDPHKCHLCSADLHIRNKVKVLGGLLEKDESYRTNPLWTEL